MMHHDVSFIGVLGTANATSILKMAEFKVDHNGAVSGMFVDSDRHLIVE